jgi:hypothetical protein
MQSETTAAGMVRTEVIDHVPNDVLAAVTQDFKDSGAASVKAEANPDGTWKIIATFPNWA